MVLTVAAGACHGRPGHPPPTNSPPPVDYDGDDFYAMPDPLPVGRHGDLIRYQAIDDPYLVGARHWRIMYHSTSVAGDPIVVTGTVAVPQGAAPRRGRDILTVGHGTSGIADECAPSRTAGQTPDAVAAAGVAAGYVTATSDYEGLGTPGRHPYLVGVSEGRSVLDAAVAARQLPAARAGHRLAIAGYSQGGHAALWAGQLAETWTPQFDVVGTFAGAPATELAFILAVPPNGFLLMIIAGYEAGYPGRAEPAQLLTPVGVDALDLVDEGCVVEVLDSVAALPADQLLHGDLAGNLAWAGLLSENDPGRVAADPPILVVHSATDDVAPAVLSQLMVGRMCGLGQQVERRVYEDGSTHLEAATRAYTDGFAWIEARFAGEQAATTCP